MKDKNNLKGRFVGLLRLEYIDGLTWRVINPDDGNMFSFVLDDGRSITPPDGMITDFASIPRLGWSVLPPCGNGPSGRYGKGAVIHDYIYKTGRVNGRPVTQHEADHVLKACNESESVDEVTTHIIHDALVVGGHVAWHNYREMEKAA